MIYFMHLLRCILKALEINQRQNMKSGKNSILSQQEKAAVQADKKQQQTKQKKKPAVKSAVSRCVHILLCSGKQFSQFTLIVCLETKDSYLFFVLLLKQQFKVTFPPPLGKLLAPIACMCLCVQEGLALTKGEVALHRSSIMLWVY